MMALHELAEKPVPLELLINIPHLVSAYYTGHPDAADVAQQVSFGTSGHRGTSTEGSFNEDHILAISQAIADYRKAGEDGRGWADKLRTAQWPCGISLGKAHI